MYLLLRADGRPKQNHKDVLLPAHLQELYPSGKESELILSQKINRPSLAQRQTTDYSSSSWSSTSRRWSDWILENQRNIFGTNWSTLNIGLVKCGRVQCQNAQETSKDFNTFLIWTIKDNHQNHFVLSRQLSDEKWKSSMARGGGNRKIFPHCTDPSVQEILYLRALQGHSGRNTIDPELQDNVLIPNDFFEYIYHIGCAINLHSITNSGLIPGGQNFSKRQTVFFTSLALINKEHKDPDEIDPNAPRLAWYKQKVWKKFQTQSNAIILHDTFPAYCIPKAIMMGTGEIIYEKVHASPRPPPMISFRDNWMTELGSEVAGGGKESQQTQPKTKNPIVRTGQPVSAEQPSGSSAQEIDKRDLLDCESTTVRTERPVDSCVPVSVERLEKDKDADEDVDADHVRTWRPVENEQSIGLFTQREEVDIDFRVSGLPRAVLKQADNFGVRELVKKIESHLHRQPLQADSQQSNAYNPFSDESKAMIREMGNVEFFELCETIPKVQCSECVLYWNQGVIYCGHLLVESESSQIF